MTSHLGEILSLCVAMIWTCTAIFADEASHRIGSNTVNVIRLVLGTFFLGALLWITIGAPWPLYADSRTWMWLAFSALVGYVFGDFCLFNCYIYVGARIGQLFMTIAPLMAAIAGWIMLGETMSWKGWIAMAITLTGIAISILSRGEDHHLHTSLPLIGILLGIGAGIGQGVGLVLSKIGMQYYADAIPEEATRVATMMPFAATMIRAIVGGAGFLLIMTLSRKLYMLRDATHNRKGLIFAILVTLTGPVLGVSLSLMAVRYANAGIASTLMALSPVFILLPYSIIYKKKISLRELLGVVVSVTGVAIFFLI